MQFQRRIKKAMKQPINRQSDLSSRGQLPKHLELFEKDCRLVAVTFSISMYTNTPLSSIPKAVLTSYERFLRLCPSDQLRFYITENMSRHKPVNPRVMGMLGTWLKPDAPKKEDINLELKDGTVYQDAPKFAFEVCGSEEGYCWFRGGRKRAQDDLPFGMGGG